MRPVDEFRVCAEAFVGAESESFHDAGAEPFDESVGLGDEAEDCRDGVGVFEVDGDGAASAVEDVELGAGTGGGFSVDADDVCAEVCEHHGAEGSGADAGDFDDFDSV